MTHGARLQTSVVWNGLEFDRSLFKFLASEIRAFHHHLLFHHFHFKTFALQSRYITNIQHDTFSFFTVLQK